MATSTVDPSLPPLKAAYPPSKPDISRESPQTQALISHLNLQPHIEGGYFVETDRDVRRVPNPFLDSTSSSDKDSSSQTRAASTSIHYLLTPSTPLGAFHRNRGRTVHTLHKGRARYVIIHADEVASPSRPNGYNPSSPDGQETGDEQSFWTRGKARVETFVVGGDVIGGEKLQWIVEGGKYKASFLLEDKTEDGGWKGKGEGTGCLISETVVPGFEYEDHDFLKRERAEVLLSREQLEEMGWMLRVD